MAKQTFTTGQVLTAAQMTSLQQTSMGGGSTTAKTASYVLVAADAGTVVQMNSASATTITVNTALFAAGDTVQIQNVGAGVCTVTAGTATVSTAGSLALSQYEGGQLYFNTTSAALFFDIVQGSGMTNPMTTTGDIIYSSSGSTPARLGIGTTGQVVTVASGLPSWATPTAAASGLTLIKRATTTAAADTGTTFDGMFNSTYAIYMIVIESAFSSASSPNVRFQWRNAAATKSTSDYYGISGGKNYLAAAADISTSAVGAQLLCPTGAAIGDSSSMVLYAANTRTATLPQIYGNFFAAGATVAGFIGGKYNVAASVDGFIVSLTSNNITCVISVYGLAVV